MTTKQYLRFSPAAVFGIIASSTAKIIAIKKSNIKDSLYAVPACENVYIWNPRTREKDLILNGEKSPATCLASDDNRNIAVGYADGTVRIFDLQTGGECIVSFIGHKSPVSCLTFIDGGQNLASGGKDSEIVVWNVIDESGLYRLKGHKGPVTQCLFFKPNNVLISSSKDTYIKFWDLDTQHCFYTLVGCQQEILDISLIKGNKLICGLNSKKLKIWNIILDGKEQSNGVHPKKLRIQSSEADDIIDDIDLVANEFNDEEEDSRLKVSEVGDLFTAEKKTSAIVVDATERLIGVHGSTKMLHLYKILSPAEIAKKLRKRCKKETKRKSVDDDEVDSVPAFEDEFLAMKPIPMDSKIDSFTMEVEKEDTATITVLLKNNSLVQCQIDFKLKDYSMEFSRSILLPGHRSFVRTLTCSSDGSAILSACDVSVKIWKSSNDDQNCVATLDCDVSTCSVFVPGDSHCIIGTKKGKLNVFNIESRELLESVIAHEGTVKCLTTFPQKNGVTSGGSDKDVKFWDFDLVADDESKKHLTLVLRKKLQMPEEIMCLKYSPDGNKLAVALLDSTVQVLFTDSLKLAFSLYGHEFPVTCLDISHDSRLIITGSHDRTIRIWSMEFGSCNKRLRIANEKGTPDDKGINCLLFLPKSHLFFSAGKDHVVRQWDADIFQKIITLKGHQNEVSAMCVSPDGHYVVTASRDRSMRMWEKTTEPLVLQEEQENEAEENDKETEDLPEIPGEVNKEVALSGMKTVETIQTVDRLIEDLELYAVEVSKLKDPECKNVQLHPLFLAYGVDSPLAYIRKMVKKIKPSELEGALLHLPFNYVLEFLKVLAEFVEKGWETEFSEKSVTFLVRIHFGELSTTQSFKPVLETLKSKLFQQMYHMRDLVGFVKVVSNQHQKSIESKEEVSMFAGILDDVKKKKKRARRRLERPVVTFS